MTTTPAAAAGLDGRLAALRHRVDGEVLVPGDAGFHAYGRDAAVIVVAADVGDVVATARFATESGVEVWLDTSGMDDVELDAEDRTCWVGPGARWSGVVATTARHRLAPITGASIAANAVDSALAGEHGWLARRHGAAAGAVRSFEVVTPGGELVRCCPNEHADLFDALLAGDGDGSAVVTEMEIELVPVSGVYAGDLAYPPAAAADVVSRWSAWAPTTPDELTSSVLITGSSVLVRGCWCGDPNAGRAVLDDWRSIMPPESDSWHLMAFAELTAETAPPQAATTRWLTDPIPGAGLPPEVGATLSRQASRIEIRHVGGSTAAADRHFLMNSF